MSSRVVALDRHALRYVATGRAVALDKPQAYQGHREASRKLAHPFAGCYCTIDAK